VDPALARQLLELVDHHPERIADQVRAWLKDPAND
jgi:flagellar biosynthesis/type III secretory pathway M-ring protein FliF/YscJ